MSLSYVIAILLACIAHPSTADNNPTLKLVNVLFRHGDRAPIVNFPKDPQPTWPDGLGELTPRGMRMEYSLGNFIRRRYDGFISKRYKHTEVVIKSSDLNRCLESAYSNIAGIFPPSGDQVWNSNFTWQPIPVHSRPREEDNMLAISKPCPKYDKLYQDSLKTDAMVAEENKNKEFYTMLEEKTGIKPLSIFNIWKVIDTLHCQREHNISNPSWVNDTVYERLEELWRVNFGNLYQGKELSRLKGGPILKEWIKLTKQMIDGTSYTHKMNMFSAHDTTVIALLNALQVYNHMLPPYTITVFMELHKKPDQPHHVEFYLRNHSSTDPADDFQPIPLTLPGCDFECPFDKFVTLTRDRVPTDWDAECQLTAPPTVSTYKYKTAFVATISVFSVVIVLLIVAGIVIFKRSRGQGHDMS